MSTKTQTVDPEVLATVFSSYFPVNEDDLIKLYTANVEHNTFSTAVEWGKLCYVLDKEKPSLGKKFPRDNLKFTVRVATLLNGMNDELFAGSILGYGSCCIAALVHANMTDVKFLAKLYTPDDTEPPAKKPKETESEKVKETVAAASEAYDEKSILEQIKKLLK